MFNKDELIGLHPDSALQILKERDIVAGGYKHTKAIKPPEGSRILRVVRADINQDNSVSLVVAYFPKFKDNENIPSSLSSWG